MTTLVGIILGLIAIVLLLQVVVRANPRSLARFVRGLLGTIIALVGLYFTIRGNLFAGPPLLMFGLGWVGREFGIGGGFGLGGGGFGGRGPSGNQRSRVRTSLLAMELDHDTGEMNGEVLAGNFQGRRLSDMTPQELTALYSEAAQTPDQSRALLEAYLDRAHSGWREGAGAAGGAQGQGDQAGASAAGSQTMSEREAWEILGLQPGASDDEVRAAHKALMKQYHPDRGGSAYLAAKINQAKDILLGKGTRRR